MQHRQVTSNHNRNTRRPSETVASFGGPEPRDGRRGTGSAREKTRRSARNPRKVIGVMWKMGDTWVEREKKRRQESVGSVGSVNADPKDLENRKEAEREAQGAQGSNVNC